MSLRPLPAIQAFTRPDGMTWDAPAEAMERWTPFAAADSDDPADISIYDVIGEDPWSGGGWTARRMAGVLRNVGTREVTVSINSPGGDVFEGIAIYNLLREHKARVNMRVMGLAASAASLVAMAGDDIRMGAGTMLMVHNAWGLTVGNRHDHADAIGVLQPIDEAMADIYAARTGKPKKKMAELMDAETWMAASQAVEQGFADGVLDAPAPPQAAAKPGVMARHQLDVILAKSGMPRSERRRLMRDLTSDGTPGAAAASATRDAGLSAAAAPSLQQLLATLRT